MPTDDTSIPGFTVSEDDPSIKFGKFLANPPPGEEIIVTGLSGTYPDSENVHHFRDNLFNKVDLVSDDERRWEPGHPEIPQRTGKLLDISKFDAGYFGLHWRQASSLDPGARILLEHVTAAIIDAGYHPEELEGSNTGVYLGICFNESEKVWYYDNLMENWYGITGCMRSMLANRVSYFFKFKGPSIVCDTACSSSMYALEQAYKDIRTGIIDQAIVTSITLCLHPFVSLQFARLGVLSMDGRCKAFDQDGNGYARSETVCAILVQKAKNARRNYCKVVHAKTNCDGFKDSGITYPSGEMQVRLLKEFYSECNFKASDLTFLEAHGTGTKVGDPEECLSIDEVFTPGRKNPLLIGSVKSNIGHTEPSSGLCSLTKAIIAYETGYIAPNLNYTKPRQGMTGLEAGRLSVVTEKTPLPDKKGLIGVNNFGFGGGNGHVLFEWNHKEKVNKGSPKDDVPRLVCVSGRTVEAVESLLDDVSRDLDYEHVRLLQDVFRKNIKTHIYRGFTIASKSKEITRSISKYIEEGRALYILFEEYTKEELRNTKYFMEIPTFASTFSKVNDILNSKNFKLEACISKNNLTNGEHYLLNLAVQISFVNVLKEIGLKFEAKSSGNIVSFYANNVLNLNEAVECGYAIASTKFDSTQSKVTPNGNLHVNGNTTDIKNTNILKQKITQILSNGKKTMTVVNKIVDNILNTNNTLNNIKNDSKNIYITLGKKSLASSDTNISLNIDLNSFLKTLGNLYQLGFDLNLHKLYPKVDLPVSRSTKMIAPKVKWNHDRTWWTATFRREDQTSIGESQYRVVLEDRNYAFYEGHTIDGRVLVPATGYLELVWSTLAHIRSLMITDTRVVFENCKFLRACVVPKALSNALDLTVMIQKGSGCFEIIEGGSPVVTGRVRICDNVSEDLTELESIGDDSITDDFNMKTKDIYKELKLRGYNYSGLFKGLECFDTTRNIGKVKWDGNFTSFMDTMLQTYIIKEDTRLLYVPTTISKLIIDAKKHVEFANKLGENPSLTVKVSKKSGAIRSGFVEIRGLIASSIPRRKYLGTPVLEKYIFVPNVTELSTEQSVRVNVQMILENTPVYKVKVVELIDEATKENSELLAPVVSDSLSDLPLIQPDITVLSKEPLEIKNIKVEDKKLLTETDCMLIIGSELLQRVQILQVAFKSLKKDAGYIISRENLDFNTNNLIGIDILTIHTTTNEKLILFRKQLEYKTPTIHEISLKNKNFAWLPKLQETLKNSDDSVLVYSQNEPQSGILGLTNCLRREPSGKNVKCLFIADDGAAKFNLNEPFYLEQLKKNMVVNVLKEGKWGTYRHLLLDKNWEVEREHAFVHSTARGDFSNIKWIEGPLSKNMRVEPERELVEIYTAALNFRDVMVASGRINADAITRDRLEQECIQGFEFAGKTLSGRRVMGLVTRCALSNLIQADKLLLWDIPDEVSIEDAATIPVAYATCVYGFILRARCKPGDTVLIHSGTGGVGLAAITLTLYLGCTVYTTVGTPEKREYLKERFPQLSDKNIFNSRTLDFEKDILRETKGRGVDIVLNSLSEAKLIASVRCLARGGHFLEIGKYDFANDNRLNTMLFKKEITFHGIMLDAYINRPAREKAAIHSMMAQLFAQGAIVPLKKNLFKAESVEEAFRFMTTGKHMGKVLLQVKSENSTQNNTQLLKCLPRFYCDETKSYVICGGLGGFGLELADWLVLRGARNLILTSRNGVKTGYQNYRIQIWKSYGCLVKICTQDITTYEGCKSLLTEASNVAPVKAIFNLAVVLKDAVLENQTEETFNISFAPKAFATEYLDDLSRKLCPELSDFVIFSSVSCGRGNAGQTNYGMANSVMEKICEQRKNAGYPALAIEWGAVGDVGLVAEMQEAHTELAIGGTLQQRISNCLQVMDVLMGQNESAIVSSMVVAEKKSGAGDADNIVDAVANILGIKDMKTISRHATLAEAGMDSMTAVEVKQTLESEYGVFLTAQDLRTLTFARLQEIQDDLNAQSGEEKKEKALVGFNMILRVIGDQSTANVPAIKMKSKPSEKNNLKNIVLFAGIEGGSKALEPLASNLEGNLTCIQYCSNSKDESIEQIAKTCLPYVEEIYNKDDEFNIIAYSFGALIGLEVVKMLEQKGYKGQLIIIDGAPEYFKTVANSLEIDKEDALQTKIMMHILGLQIGHDKILPHIEAIYKCNSLDDRINLGTTILGDSSPLSKEYQRELSESSYKRIKALIRYENKFKLKTEIKLLKPELPSAQISSEDYFLSEYTERPVVHRTFSGNHASILENEKVADLINALVGGQTVEEWEKQVENVEEDSNEKSIN